MRVPAAMNGCTGFIASRNRIGPQGPSFATSIGQTGVLTTCARDAALVYSVMADRGAAPLRLPALKGGAGGLQGLRIGVFATWFDDCDDGVRRACESAVAALQKAGAPLQTCYLLCQSCTDTENTVD